MGFEEITVWKYMLSDAGELPLGVSGVTGQGRGWLPLRQPLVIWSWDTTQATADLLFVVMF